MGVNSIEQWSDVLSENLCRIPVCEAYNVRELTYYIFWTFFQ